jgi:hypothetical protein
MRNPRWEDLVQGHIAGWRTQLLIFLLAVLLQSPRMLSAVSFSTYLGGKGTDKLTDKQASLFLCFFLVIGPLLLHLLPPSSREEELMGPNL